MAVADRVARGESPEQAHAAAVRGMGNPPLVADVTRRQWSWQWLERGGHDLRYALRQLRKSPGYTVTALLTLTLAVGANTAIFGLFYALLLRSLPMERPDQIAQIELQLSVAGGATAEPRYPMACSICSPRRRPPSAGCADEKKTTSPCMRRREPAPRRRRC